ncbi:MAG TPA: hypothetical protein VHU22_10615 [Xanthobacteraceae bacterium]|jgi:hypothetical protein|nr:hypothetical protein [Xanthobacteraceae bacterium]
MTNESDSTTSGTSGSAPGRRPPTIELTAKEVEQATAPQNTAEAKPDPAPQTEQPTEANSEKQEASPAQPQTPDAPEPKPARSGSNPLTHAISAAIGAIAALAVLAGLWLAGFTFARDVVNSQIAASENASPNSANAEITARLDKIEHALQAPRPETTNVPPALGNRLTAVEMQTKMLGDSAAALTHRLDDIAATAQAAQKQAGSAEAVAKSAGQSGVQTSDIETLTSRIATLESAVKSLSDQVAHPPAAVDQSLRLAVTTQALQAAVERGVPYRAELKAVQSLGADQSAIAPLEAFAATGLPPAAALAHELAALVPALRQAANPTPADASFFDKLKANAQKLVEFTPAEPPSGNDPAAVSTRIDIAADRGEIGAALQDIAALPDRIKPLTADWAKKAQAREDAIAASRNISADALAAISKPAAQ